MGDHLVDASPDESVGLPPPTATTDHTTTDHTTTDGAAAARASRRWRWRERRRARVSRWDRPPQPKDWRFVVATLGRTLIVIGLLMFGFVGYQLWGTGIETAIAQRQLGSEFDQRSEQLTADRDPIIGIDNWVMPELEIDTDATPGVEDDPEPVTGSGNLANRFDDTPSPRAPSAVVPGGEDLSDFAVEQNVPVSADESFARLEIPSIGVDEFVVPGVTVDQLKKGPGHFPDTPLPGQLGNASLAGHRTTYGAPFFRLDELEPGDEIVVEMVTGDRFVYEVTATQVVTPSDYWVITTRDPTVAELTLTTCDPKWSATNRLIVHSVLVPEKSAQVGLPEFYRFDENGAVPLDPADDPTFASPDADTAGTGDTAAADEVELDDAVDSDDAVGSDEVVESDDATEPDASTTDDATVVEPADAATPAPIAGAGLVAFDPDTAELDAFSEGWFDDNAAWAQIVLWGAVLLAIALGAYHLAKWRRNLAYAYLVGAVPFVVALYFFYQNVNRLLPPGL